MVELAPELPAPWLGLYGDEDQGIPADQVEALRTAVAKGEGAPPRSCATPGPGHGFHCDMRPDYHPEARRRRLEAHPGLVREVPAGEVTRQELRASIRRRERPWVDRRGPGRGAGPAVRTKADATPVSVKRSPTGSWVGPGDHRTPLHRTCLRVGTEWTLDWTNPGQPGREMHGTAGDTGGMPDRWRQERSCAGPGRGAPGGSAGSPASSSETPFGVFGMKEKPPIMYLM